MGGAINLLSGPGQVSETAKVRQGIQGAGFRDLFGTATEAGEASGRPVPTTLVSTSHETLQYRLAELRERALANVAPEQIEGQTQEVASGGLAGLVSSLALAVAEFDQETGLGLTPALRSGLTPEVVGGELVDGGLADGGLADGGLAAIPGTLESGVPESLNDSLQALVAVVGFVDRTVQALPIASVGLLTTQFSDGAIFGTKAGITIAQDENTLATTGKAAGVLAGNPPNTDGNPAVTTGVAALTSGENSAKSPVVGATQVAGQTLPPVGLSGTQLDDGAIFGTTAGVATAQGENTPTATTNAASVLAVRGALTSGENASKSPAVAATPVAAQTLPPMGLPEEGLPVGLSGTQLADDAILGPKAGATTAQDESTLATTGKAAGVLAGNQPKTGDGIGVNPTTGGNPAVTPGAGALTSGENSAKSPAVVPIPVAAQNLPPVAYAAILSEEAVSAGTVSIPEQPRPGLLRGVESGALPVVGEPGSVRKAVVGTPSQTLAAQQEGLGGVLRQAGDAAARTVEAGAIGSRTSPAVVTDPRLMLSSAGSSGAPDPAPALLGQVVTQAFGVLETGRERGAGPTWERPVELNPLAGSETFMRARSDTGRLGLERTAGSDAPNRSRFATALTAQIRATEGRTLIELSPRGLGQVEVDIRTEADGSMKVTIRADNLMVLSTLRDAREILAQSFGATDGSVLDFQEGSLGQDQGKQGPAPANGFTGDDEGSATAAEPVAQSQAIGGGQLDIMT